MPGESRHQPDAYRYVIAGLILSAHLCLGLNLFAVSPVLPLIIQDYSISSTAASLLVAVTLLVAAAVGLPGGLITIRLGMKISLALAWLSMGILALSVFAPNYPTLLLLRLLSGFGGALVLTATGPLLVAWFRPTEVVLMNGLNTAVLSLGVAISVGGVAPLAELIGWKTALTVFGGLGVVGGVAWLALGRDSPGASPLERISLKQVPGILNRRPIILLLMADAGVLVQYTALTAWLPTFFFESRNMSLSQAGLVSGLLPFVGVFGVLLGGVLPLRFPSPRLFLLVPGVMVILGGLGSFLLENTLATYAGLALLGLGSWLYVPTLLSLSMSLVDRDPAKVAVVWGSLITFSGFAMFASPILVGFSRDASDSFYPGFLISWMAAWMLLVSGLLISVGPAGNRRQPGGVEAS